MLHLLHLPPVVYATTQTQARVPRYILTSPASSKRGYLLKDSQPGGGGKSNSWGTQATVGERKKGRGDGPSLSLAVPPPIQDCHDEVAVELARREAITMKRLQRGMPE